MARSFYHVLEDELNVICATRASAGESAAMVLAGGLILLGQNCAHGFLQDHGWGGQQDDGHAQLLLKTMSAVSGYLPHMNRIITKII